MFPALLNHLIFVASAALSTRYTRNYIDYNRYIHGRYSGAGYRISNIKKVDVINLVIIIIIHRADTVIVRLQVKNGDKLRARWQWQK